MDVGRGQRSQDLEGWGRKFLDSAFPPFPLKSLKRFKVPLEPFGTSLNILKLLNPLKALFSADVLHSVTLPYSWLFGSVLWTCLWHSYLLLSALSKLSLSSLSQLSLSAHSHLFLQRKALFLTFYKGKPGPMLDSNQPFLFIGPLEKWPLHAWISPKNGALRFGQRHFWVPIGFPDNL